MRKLRFDGDISNWDVSKVTNMAAMFSNSEFWGDISQWKVADNVDVSFMFNNIYDDVKCYKIGWYQRAVHKIIDSAKDASGKVVAKDKFHLECLIDAAIGAYGSECDLNFIDVSKN